MIEQVTFDQIHLFWPVFLGAVLLWGLFVWKEWTGLTGTRFYIKLGVSLIAVSSLAMIALKPFIQTTQQLAFTAILSSGYQKSQIDSLKSVHNKLKIIQYKPGMDLTNDIQTGQEVFLLGQGLHSFDLWQLDKTMVHFLAGRGAQGVSRLNYSQRNIVGNDFVVKGEYHKAFKGLQLVLMGPGNTPTDSVSLSTELNQIFSLQTPHLVPGKFVYTLVEKDSLGKELSSSPLGVHIKDKDKLNILIINEFPRFETKYLKNFLAESGHVVKVRSQVSEERYKYEYFNTKQKSPIDLKTGNLKEIDLLIIDAVSLLNASKTTVQEIERTIANQGLGVFVQADERMNNARMPLLKLSFAAQADKELIIENDPEVNVRTYPYVIKNEVLLEVIQESNKGIITAYKRIGAGRIGTTVIQNSYELILEGKSEVYKSLWSNMISSIAKRKSVDTDWNKNEMMVYRDAPFHFEINTVEQNPLVYSMDGFLIPLARDIDLKQVWRGVTFPRKLGWNHFAMEHDSAAVYNFFVLDATQWTSLVAFKNRSENKRYVNKQEKRAQKTTVLKPVQQWWFFILFLLAMSFLWLEPKL